MLQVEEERAVKESFFFIKLFLVMEVQELFEEEGKKVVIEVFVEGKSVEEEEKLAENLEEKKVQLYLFLYC